MGDHNVTTPDFAALAARAEIQLEIEEEDTPVRGALASGDDAEDKACEDEILARLERGDSWAWCMVKVSARFDEFEGVSYLGCCSYRDEKEFRQSGDNFDYMVKEARGELAKELERAWVKVQLWNADR